MCSNAYMMTLQILKFEDLQKEKQKSTYLDNETIFLFVFFSKKIHSLRIKNYNIQKMFSSGGNL